MEDKILEITYIIFSVGKNAHKKYRLPQHSECSSFCRQGKHREFTYHHLKHGEFSCYKVKIRYFISSGNCLGCEMFGQVLNITEHNKYQGRNNHIGGSLSFAYCTEKVPKIFSRNKL